MTDGVNPVPSEPGREQSGDQSVNRSEGAPSLDSGAFENLALNPRTSTPLSFEINDIDAENLIVALHPVECEITPHGFQEIFKMLSDPGHQISGHWVVEDGIASVYARTTEDIAEDGGTESVRHSVTICDAFGVEANNVNLVLLPVPGAPDKATVIFEFESNEFAELEYFWEQAAVIAKSFNVDLDAAMSSVTRQGQEYVVTENGVQLRFGDSAALYERQRTMRINPEMESLVNAVIEQEGWEDYSVVEPLPGQPLEGYFRMIEQDEMLPEPPRVLVFDGIVTLQHEFMDLEDIKESMKIQLSERVVPQAAETVPAAMRIVTSRPDNVIGVLAEVGLSIDRAQALRLVDVASGEQRAATSFIESLYITGKEVTSTTERFESPDFSETRVTLEVDYREIPVAIEFALGDERIGHGDEMVISVRVPDIAELDPTSVQKAWDLMNLLAIEFGIETMAPPLEAARSIEQQNTIGYWILEDENLPDEYSGRIAIELRDL